MATLDQLSTYLDSEDVGTEGTDLFTTEMPDHPDACVALFETGGRDPDPGFGASAVRIERPAVQILARGAPDDYNGPRAKAQAAWDAMLKIEGEALSGVQYWLVQALQSPFHVTTDENDRLLFSSNFLIEKEPG
jgi:hypothetical protein